MKIGVVSYYRYPLEKILTMGLPELRQLSLPYNVDRDLTFEEITHILRCCDALWLHSGDPKHPHAELTSGKCSNGFVDVLRMLKHTNLCLLFADQLLRRFRAKFPKTNVGLVIGSDHAGATLSFAVAALLRARHDFTSKGPDRKQIWQRFAIQPDEPILQVEELITTTSTLQAVREGIRSGNQNPVSFVPAILTLVHRSDIYKFDGDPILHLAHYNIATWSPAKCPLCAVGSKRFKLKTNWAELTAP
mgnify:CR=1 FL=1